MYTMLRLEENDMITYILILTDNTCSQYDFLTYDTIYDIFVDECFTYDSFLTQQGNNEDKKNMICKIGEMINEIGLQKLMYKKIKEYKGIKIETIHIPECYSFKQEYL